MNQRLLLVISVVLVAGALLGLLVSGAPLVILGLVGSLLGIGILGALLLRPVLFLGATMAIYGSLQWLLQGIRVPGWGINAAQGMIVAVTGLMVFRLLLAANHCHRPPKSILLGIALPLWFLVPLALSPSVSSAISVFMKLAACSVGLLFAWCFVRNVHDLAQVVVGGLIASTSASLLAIKQFLHPGPLEAIQAGATRAMGGFGGPVATGTVAFFGAALGVAVFQHGLGVRKAKLVGVIAVASGIGGVIATFTRTAMVGALLFASGMLFHGTGKTRVRRASRLIGGLLLFAALIGGVLALPEKAIEARMSDIPGLSGGVQESKIGSGRGAIWAVVMRRQMDAPLARWILGHGLLSVPRDLLQVLGVPLVAHNSYLQCLYEAGIVGLLLFMGFAVSVLRDLRAVARSSHLVVGGAGRTWWVYMASYYLSTMFFNSYVYMIGPRWYSLLIVGAVLGAARDEGCNTKLAG